jgi:phage gp29-like protein
MESEAVAPPTEDPRTRMEGRATLAKQFLELPIAVKSVWQGYPVVTSALQQLEQGWFLEAGLLADAVYTDDRVAACLHTRTNAVFGLPMEFKYQGEGEDQEVEDDPITALKKEIAKVIKKNFTRMLPLTAVREVFRWGLLLNLGVGENIWAWKDDLFVPTMKTWNPQTCYWRWDTRSFWLIHQDGQLELHPGDGRWVTYSPAGHNHGWLYGAIRQLGKLWLDRVFTYRDWARAEEKFALGILKAFIPADALPEDKRQFQAEVTDMPPEATVLCNVLAPDGRKFDLEMVDTQQVGTGYEIFVQRAKDLNTNIAILILGQNLSTETGSSGKSGGSASGSRAWRLQDSVRKDYLKADVATLTEMIKFQSLEPFVFMNYAWRAQELGIDWHELVPNVTWQVEPAEDKVQTANSVAQVAKALADFAQASAPVDTRALLEKVDIPVLSKDVMADQPPPAGMPERPFAEQLSLKAGGKAGIKYTAKIAEETKAKATRLLSKYRKQVMAIARGPGTLSERQAKLAALFRMQDPRDLRELMKQAMLQAHLAGKVASKIDATDR